MKFIFESVESKMKVLVRPKCFKVNIRKEIDLNSVSLLSFLVCLKVNIKKEIDLNSVYCWNKIRLTNITLRVGEFGRTKMFNICHS